MSSIPLPVNLITGLLGSGKTTTLKHLIQQKPASETWGVLINEFGDIGIDAASISPQNNLDVLEVSGGCICCTAQFGLTQALQKLLQNPQLTRLLIEPTGLGHPAKLLDTLQKNPFPRPLVLHSSLCILNPQHLTPVRWQKSAVMRDLVTLSDIIVLNKTDLCSTDELTQAHQTLDLCYPPKTQRLTTTQGQVDLDLLNKPRNKAPFVLLAGLEEHTHTTQTLHQTFKSQLPNVIESWHQSASNSSALGWIFGPQQTFNRTQLRRFFADWAQALQRGKGILKTGLEWQLLNWADDQLTLEDVAWRQDSRLELIFSEVLDSTQIEMLENQLLKAFNPPPQ
ncbi:CobW family GTP-binding protein [Thiosulfativibrio zosterae]|uniref:GTPase n=1 Tax=Thiosulfativibrio zosterae TaxID=2675053 RepID=A0A6F8PKJ6_9GAMM|nr:GTP-binding protein [Thiosulfativibrio zosterae]BBP42584.1 GTPase [Thiosulfativibrio zosterae]